MPRKVKCAITGEIGTSDSFIKIGKRYYKNQAVYDSVQKQKEDYKKLIDYICREFLGYGDGQPFPPSLPKKLKELSYYDYNVVLETFIECKQEIHYWLEHKEFASEYGKISYIVAIVKSKIADVNAVYIRKQKQEQQINRTEIECDDLSELGTKAKGKDIRRFLDDDLF